MVPSNIAEEFGTTLQNAREQLDSNLQTIGGVDLRGTIGTAKTNACTSGMGRVIGQGTCSTGSLHRSVDAYWALDGDHHCPWLTRCLEGIRGPISLCIGEA